MSNDMPGEYQDDELIGGLTHDDIVRRVDLGDQAQAFLESDLGKRLIEKSDEDRKSALIQLADVDLDKDVARARALQIEAKVAQRALTYLLEFIDERNEALEYVRASAIEG